MAATLLGLGTIAKTTGLASKLGGMGGILSGVGNLFGIGRGKRQNKRNRSNMKYQFQLDKQMWDYQNAYNTPIKQMERLKAAGLNPHLMYGQGTTGNASGAPQTKPLPAYAETPVDTAPFISGMQQMAQIKNIQAQTRKQNIDNDIALGTKSNVIKQAKLDNVKTIEETNKLITDISRQKADTKLSRMAKREVIQKIKNLQQTYEWETVKMQAEGLERDIKGQERDRANQGILKGDTLGNLLNLMDIDPSTIEGKQEAQFFIKTYFAVDTATKLLRVLK